MPPITDEQLLEQAEEWKKKGNDSFAKNEVNDAISSYSQGVVLCDRMIVLKPTLKTTLLSNRAMCYLKNKSLQDCIDDCTKALDYQNERGKLVGNSTGSDMTTNDEEIQKQLRTKLLFRRAKAKYMQSNLPNSLLPTQPNDLLQDSAKDLLALLQMDPNSTEANKLLSTVRVQHKATSSAQTPVSKTVQAIQDYLEKNDWTQCLHHVKVLLGLIDNDLNNVSMELGRLNAIPILLNVASISVTTATPSSGSTTDPKKLNDPSKLAVLSVRCVAQAGSYPPFVRMFLYKYQMDLCNLIQTVSSLSSSSSTAENCYDRSISDLIVSIISCWVRILLHVDRDDPLKGIAPDTKHEYKAIVASINAALQPCIDLANTNTNDSYMTDTILRAIMDLIGTWTCGTNRESNIRAALAANNVTDSTVPIPKTPMEIHQMSPQELSHYRKREIEQKKRDTAWAIERCNLLIKDGALSKFLHASSTCYDNTIRREAIVTIGKMIASYEEDDKMKGIAKTFLQNPNINKKVKDSPPMIEEIVEEVYNEDGEIEADEAEEAKQEAIEITSLETKMERAMVACSILLTTNKENKEVGAWVLGSGWEESDTDLPDLIHSGDTRAMCLASEVVSAAATVEAARNTVQALVSGGDMESLLMHPDRDIRSGAASAVAKLGLAHNIKQDESEYMSMLMGACELLIDDTTVKEGEGEEKTDKDRIQPKTTGINHFSSYATSATERGIEMMTYLMSNTNVKEEICDGFTPQSFGNKTSALDLLVKTADTPGVGESLTGFGLASIFRNMSATNLELRELLFEDKEFSMEQYDELQKMQKTEEEKELMENQDKDMDTRELCDERIRKMAAANVPRALVQLTEGASDHSLEQIGFCLSQMANEKSVRGTMIQQGVLSALIKSETHEGPTETDTMKKVIRMCRHTIAKLLITTNPSLLTSAQRLGCIKPLLRLIRDIKAKELQHFEALMAITNLASSGEDAKNRIVAEKGIPALHYAMFTDNPMVRRAATEAMCNLVPHKAIMEHLSEVDNIRLWLAFAEDYDEDNYECARAAAGCLAMATQGELEIANVLVSLPKFQEQMSSMLESGRLEIMHRAFCIVLNLVELNDPGILEKVKKAQLIVFCRAYIENYLRNGVEGLEFPPEEKPLLPVVLDLAKKIVRTAEPV